MAPDKRPSRTSSLRTSAQSSTFSLGSLISPDEATAAKLPDKFPIFRRSIRAASARQSLLVDDARSLDLLKNNPGPESDVLAQIQLDKADSCTAKAKAIQRSASCSAAARKSMHPATVQRWSGLTRTVSSWDGLRRVCESIYILKLC